MGVLKEHGEPSPYDLSIQSFKILSIWLVQRWKLKGPQLRQVCLLEADLRLENACGFFGSDQPRSEDKQPHLLQQGVRASANGAETSTDLSFLTLIVSIEL
jgi:hypothetical protein